MPPTISPVFNFRVLVTMLTYGRFSRVTSRLAASASSLPTCASGAPRPPPPQSILYWRRSHSRAFLGFSCVDGDLGVFGVVAHWRDVEGGADRHYRSRLVQRRAQAATVAGSA